MKIFVLTPIYATSTSMQGATPVVHYFAREWVKMGHEVIVFNFVARYPKPLYWISHRFQHQLNTRLGTLVPVKSPTNSDYEADGVIVHVRCLKKVKPHSVYSKKELTKAIDCITEECEKNGSPDWFVGHWDNPQLQLLNELKQRYGNKTCLVLHENEFHIEKTYGAEGLEMIKRLNVIGFRSKSGEFNFQRKYGKPDSSFIAASGVSSLFLEEGLKLDKVIKQPVHNYIYIGSLIARKHPVAIVSSLSKAYPDGNFTMTFIGDGAEKTHIEKEHQRLGGKGKLIFTGRIPREEIIHYLKQSDIFVMISSGEIFGLVYLEAMALGLISIGSKNEGIDGVILDGENGFLCKAGNVDDLVCVLEKINGMTDEQLRMMSNKAKETANNYSDCAVAEKYLKALSV